MQIRPVSDLRNKFPEVEKLVEGGEPVFLTKNGYGSMVVIRLEEYERLTRRVDLISESETMVGEAKNVLRCYADEELAVVVRTKTNHIFSFASKMDELKEAEEAFVQQLIHANDAEIKYLVCMWDMYALEIPSANLVKCLLEASPKNAEALIILQNHGLHGKDDFKVRTIKSIMPPQK